MGKRIHGRLVHEVRDALRRAGFMPTCVTQLGVPKRPRPTRTPGFKVEKHNDGKSVRLFHMTAAVPAKAADLHVKRSLVRAQVQMLVDYNRALEQQGFTRVACDMRGRSDPYSLWRMGEVGGHSGKVAPPNDLPDM